MKCDGKGKPVESSSRTPHSSSILFHSQSQQYLRRRRFGSQVPHRSPQSSPRLRPPFFLFLRYSLNNASFFLLFLFLLYWYHFRQWERSHCCSQAYLSHRQKLPRSLLPWQGYLLYSTHPRSNSSLLRRTSLPVSLLTTSFFSSHSLLSSHSFSLISDLATVSSSKLPVLFSPCFAPEHEMLTASFSSIPCRSFKVPTNYNYALDVFVPILQT